MAIVLLLGGCGDASGWNRGDADAAAADADAGPTDADVNDANAPEVRCANARLLTESTTLHAEVLDPGAGGTELCGVSSNDAGAYFRVRIPASSVGRISATPGSSASSVAIRLAETCASVACLTTATPSAGVAASVEYANPSTRPMEIMVLVSAPGATSEVQFDLDVLLASPAANLSCSNAQHVVSGDRVTNVPSVGGTTDVTCVAGASGGMLFYSIDVIPHGTLRATAASDEGAVAIRVYDDCSGGACLTGSVGSARWVNTSDVMRTVFVGIGGVDSSTAFLSATFAVDPPVPGAACETAIELALPSMTTDSTPADAASRLCDGSEQPARFYRVPVPANQQLTAAVTGAAGIQLRAQEACTGSCSAASTNGTLVVPAMASDRIVNLAVSAASPMAFTLTLSSATPSPTTCAGSAVYTQSAVISGDLSLASDPASNCGGHGAALYYRVALQPGQRLAASTSSSGIQLAVLLACGAASCENDLLIASTRFANTGTSPVLVVLSASGTPGSIASTFTVNLTISDIPASSRCATAPVVSVGTIASPSSDALELAPSCSGSGSLVAQFYNVDVPAGQRVSVAATSGVVRFLDSCAAPSCLSVDRGDQFGDWTAWTNDGSTTRRVILAVTGLLYANPPTSVSISIAPPVAAGRCATAPALQNGVVLTGAIAGSDEATSSCGSTLNQAALWYSVTIPPGQRARVSVRGTFISNATLSFRDACGAASCLSTVKSYATNEKIESVDNTGTVDRTVWVAVGSPRFSYSVSATFSAIPDTAYCVTAPTLVAGATLTNQHFSDAGQQVTACNGLTPASSLYRISVPAGQRLDVTLTSATPSSTVRILSDCAASSCLASRIGSPAIVRWANTASTAQDVFVAVSKVDQPFTNDLFDITATLAAFPANSQCAAPVPLTQSVAVIGRYEDASQPAANCATGSTAALYYSITVPAGQRLVATGASINGSGAPVVRILDACDTASCAGQSNGAVASWLNAGTSPRQALIAVSGNTAIAQTEFSLVATFE